MSDQNTRPQPSAEPVAYLYEKDGYRIASAERLYPGHDADHGWTETPLYPASALEAARREALEQAAKVADRIANPQNDWGDVSPVEARASTKAAEAIATAIRALKENTNG